MASIIQFSVTLRNALLATYESTIGTAPKLQLRTDAPPANCAASNIGTLIAELSLPSDWLDAPSGGTALKLGTWSGTTVAAGTVGHYRLFNTAVSVCHEQGSVTQAITLLTTAATSAGNNVITVADTTGITTGMGVAGTGISPGATVFSKTSTTVTMTAAAIAPGVSSGGAVTFGDTSGNLQLTSVTFTSGQSVIIDAKTMIAPGA